MLDVSSLQSGAAPLQIRTMHLKQLMGRYFRLRQELAQVYGQHPWHAGQIDRLTADIADVEKELAARDVPDGAWPACALATVRA